jgi:hypothetical protein
VLSLLGVALAAAAAPLVAALPAGSAPAPYLSHFTTVTQVASTIPTNGDLNPYGIVTVPFNSGNLVRGDTLISNFNAGPANTQGTGTTIVEISPRGVLSVFAQIDPNAVPNCTGGVGLTTALSVLNDGYVVVGSLPISDGGTGTPMAGCLIVLNSKGVPVETWEGNGINGPWDMTAVQFHDAAAIFVTNVLNGTVAAGVGNEVDQGTVLRLAVFMPHNGQPPVLVNTTAVGTGFPEVLNPPTVVLAPTGVALGPNDVLYVNDTDKNRIAAIPDALIRSTPSNDGMDVSVGGSLNQPLGLTMAPGGDLIAVNGNDGNAVEVTPSGAQVDTVQIDPGNAAGDLFGVTIAANGRGVLFVDDGTNTLQFLH